jgi:hypothetical protein
MMIRMAFLDGIAIIGLYLFTALHAKAWIWVPVPGTAAIFVLSGILLAYAVEYLSINILHEWAYTPYMPVVLGVGVLPLLQLSLTGLLSILVADSMSSKVRQ